MESRVRELLFEPLRKKTLSAIVPDFTAVCGTEEISAPAQVVRSDDQFEFILHFPTGRPPPGMQSRRGGFFSQSDCISVKGQVNGELAFHCADILPPLTMTSRSRGTSITLLHSNRMDLIPEGTDEMTTTEVLRMTGQPAKEDRREAKSFTAHLIYHGPRLKMWHAGTEFRTKNDFLGEAVSSTADTHQFAADTWEGALIQKELELHLHLRSLKDATVDRSSGQVIDLVDRANQSVGFVLGFQPWPAYREIRIDHQVFERWLSPRFDLSTTYLVPASEAMWSHFRNDHGNPIHQIIPTIADGLGRIPNNDRKKLTSLLWHFRSGNSSDLPSSTRLLILCAVLDGLTKLVAGARNPKKAATEKTWKKASARLGFSWDRWTKHVFEVWGKHRHLLAHGWLWLGEELNAQEFFTDRSRLGCAFLTFVAAYCGYEGPILADPFENRVMNIAEIRSQRA
jgi:hypothetical protein